VRIDLYKLCKDGVTLPREQAREHAESGELEIDEIRDADSRRLVRIARFRSVYENKPVEILYEPQLMWMRGHVFILRGFERRPEAESRTRAFLQGWMCEPRAVVVDERRLRH
jgi:hypothetical protein